MASLAILLALAVPGQSRREAQEPKQRQEHAFPPCVAA
jgi:hypothetical protein